MELKNLIAQSETVDVYKCGDMAVKVFKKGAPKTLVLYEALTHARVEETGLPVPKIHEVSIMEDGRWAIQMELVEGKTLAEIMKEDTANTSKYINDMVELQLQVHLKKMPLLNKLKDKLHSQIEELDCLDDVKKYDLLTRLDSMKKHNKLCHGNFSPENIIINDNGTFIVDWVAAAQGNASADVAKTYLLLALNDPASAELYMNLFCEKTSTSKKYVQEWLPIVAAAQLTEGKEEQKELCMKWLDVVDYE